MSDADLIKAIRSWPDDVPSPTELCVVRLADALQAIEKITWREQTADDRIKDQQRAITEIRRIASDALER